MTAQGLPGGTAGGKKSCQTCDKGMNSANQGRICRIHGRSIEPLAMLARYVEQHGCKDYEREPGSAVD